MCLSNTWKLIFFKSFAEMYQNRVIKNDTGDIPTRLKIFDSIVYKKTDYFFRQRQALKQTKTLFFGWRAIKFAFFKF